VVYRSQQMSFLGLAANALGAPLVLFVSASGILSFSVALSLGFVATQRRASDALIYATVAELAAVLSLLYTRSSGKLL
jgi:hypothetical protein